jgi:hypothetical protein
MDFDSIFVTLFEELDDSIMNLIENLNDYMLTLECIF